MRHVRFTFGLFFGLCVWVLISVYIASVNKSSYIPPKYGKQIWFLTADCRYRRFGNAMFNYASLLGIAKANNRTPVLPFDLSIRKMLKCSMIKGGHQFNFGAYIGYYGGRSGTYSSHTEHLPKERNIKLTGFFQSWKYFTNVEDELRMRHFVFLPEIAARVDQHMQQEVSKHISLNVNRTFVGVHVRRGDMMYQHLLRDGFVPATHQYFQNAMDYFRNRFTNVLFFLCTDTPEWVKLNIYGEDILQCDGNSATLDFAILSKCNHSIISVGTFGWWAAWIADGTTIYYDGWPKPNTRLSYEVTKADYFLPHWIPMS